MPSIEITAEQRERFDALRDRLEAAQAGEYASVRPADAMEYLLDLADETDDLAPGDASDVPSESDDTGSAESESDDGEGEAEEGVDDGGADDEAADDGGGAAPGSAGGGGILDILGNHEDRWREADGEARYEVDLPGGGVETARTRDDVKAILFEHYR